MKDLPSSIIIYNDANSINAAAQYDTDVQPPAELLVLEIMSMRQRMRER